MVKLRFVTTANMLAPSSCFGDVTAALSQDLLEDVGLETGSSHSDVCVIDGHAVSSAKVGFVTTPSVSAPFSNVGDVTVALNENPTRRCRPRNRK